MRFSLKDRVGREIEKETLNNSNKMRFPFVTLALGITSACIHYKWNKWNNRRAEKAFVFSEMNFLKNKNYQTVLLTPLSFENSFFFYSNFPGLVYSSFLVETIFGSKVLLSAYLLNCAASALTTVITHRQIGFHKVQQRGRFSNTNGNSALFLTTMFFTVLPHFKMH